MEINFTGFARRAYETADIGLHEEMIEWRLCVAVD